MIVEITDMLFQTLMLPYHIINSISNYYIIYNFGNQIALFPFILNYVVFLWDSPLSYKEYRFLILLII